MHSFVVNIATPLKEFQRYTIRKACPKAFAFSEVILLFERGKRSCEGVCGWPCLGDPMKGLGPLLEVSDGLQTICTCVSFLLTVSGKAS